MKVFISWSGDRSRAIAHALHDWLPDVIQDLEPYMSESDIGAGTRWASELAKTLDKIDIGILCVTPENINAPWLLFEAGSLAKKLDLSRVIPYRLDLRSTDIAFPLAQFQSVEANREGTLKLIKNLNALRDQPLDHERVERLYTKFWVDLEQRIKLAVVMPSEHSPSRKERDILEEILQLVRNQQSISLMTLTEYLDQDFEHIGEKTSATIGVTADVYWHEQGFTRDEAVELCGALKSHGIPCRLAEHRDDRPPDAIFMGAFVTARAAKIAFNLIPYEIKFIFGPDYPEIQGGSSSGNKIGIGYRSTHLEDIEQPTVDPKPVSNDDIAELTEKGISNIEFQQRIRRLVQVR